MDIYGTQLHIRHYYHQVMLYYNFEIYVLNRREYHDRIDDQPK
jgi:hypothetical protein